jgi:hypothetical protein
MGFALAYKTVLEVAVWHHFWVDPDGGTFTLPPNPGTPEALDRLFDYDIRHLLDISPTRSSLEWIRRKGLIFKPTQTGCLLVSRDGYTESNGETRLTLSLSIRDPQLLRHTDLGIAKFEGRIFHLTNFDRTPAARTLLTDEGSGQLEATHFVLQRGRLLRLVQQTPGTATTIEIFDALSAATDPILTVDLPAVPDQPEYAIDARALPEGLYRIESPNTVTTTLYLGIEDIPNAVGVIDLFIKDWDAAIYDIRMAKA